MIVYQVIGTELGSTFGGGGDWVVRTFLHKKDAEKCVKYNTRQLKPLEARIVSYRVKELTVLE